MRKEVVNARKRKDEIFYQLLIETPLEYELCSRRLPFKKSRAACTYYRNTGEFVLSYKNEYDCDYEYMLYTEPVVYPVI